MRYRIPDAVNTKLLESGQVDSLIEKLSKDRMRFKFCMGCQKEHLVPF